MFYTVKMELGKEINSRVTPKIEMRKNRGGLEWAKPKYV